MKKNRTITILAIFFALNLLVPCLVYAQKPLEGPPDNIDVVKVLGKVSETLTDIAIPIAVIMIIVSGFFFMTAQGEPSKVDIAKKMLLWTLIGLAVVLLSDGLIKLVKTLATK